MFKIWGWFKDKSGRQELLSAPTIPDALPDIPGGQPNLIPIGKLSTPLRIDIPEWQNSNPTKDRPETLELFLNRARVALKLFDEPVQESDRYIEVPVNRLIEGEYDLYYRIVNWMENEFACDPIKVTIDLTSPVPSGRPLALVFPEDVVRDGISARYLLEHDDQVVATVPALGTLGPGDSVTWYWEEDAEGNRPLGTDTLSQDDIGKPLTVVFKGDDLRRLNNGSRVATYRLHDRAGNPTELSALVRLNVDIAPPAPRQRPSVLEADASGGTFTLNPRKALAGATVQVPGLADDRPGDGIRVYWKGDNAYDSVEVGEGHDLKFAVAPGVVAASMGTSIQVFYDVTWPGFDPDRSGIVALAVDALPQNAYTTISCDEATVNPVTLSLANALEGARLTLDPWVFKPFAAGQCLTVNVTGIGLEAPVTIADAMPVEADRQKVYVHLPRELLLRITVGTQFRIHPKASFNGAASFHPFPELDIRLVP